VVSGSRSPDAFGKVMGRLVPDEVTVTHDVNINLNLNIPHPDRISSSVSNLIWTFALASIVRSRLKK
jgi:hypothetical protein